MPRVTPLILTVALLATACSGGSDAAPTTTTGTTPDTTPATAAETTTTVTSTTTTTIAPTTTLDDAAILAEAEAAFLRAFRVGKEVIRDPDDPENEELLRSLYTGDGLESVTESLRLTREGNFISVENEENPSLATIVESASYVDGDTTVARMTVCEFNSDRLFERGTAPDGGDSLVRDDPVSILFVIRMNMIDGVWKLQAGTRGEEIRSEDEQCSSAS